MHPTNFFISSISKSAARQNWRAHFCGLQAEQAAEDDRIRFDEARSEIKALSEKHGIRANDDEIAAVATIVRESGRHPLDALEEWSERKAIEEMDDHVDAVPEEDDIPFEEIADEKTDDQQARGSEVVAPEGVEEARIARTSQGDAAGRDVAEPGRQGQEGRRQDLTPATEQTAAGEQTVIPGACKTAKICRHIDRPISNRRRIDG